MTLTKTCSKCHETKPLGEFHKSKDGKYSRRSYCKRCIREESKKYAQKHKEEKAEYNRNYSREHHEEKAEYNRDYRMKQNSGHKFMHENKFCASYLGVVIGERLCRYLFKDVEMMPYGFPDYDMICNKGKKINVKAACITLNHGKNPCWKFQINHNKVPDHFILVAFDNRTDLNPLHMWMIPGKEINDHKTSISISPSTIDKWDKWKRDINDAQLCCAEIRKNNK